jgi:hypothetical protein
MDGARQTSVGVYGDEARSLIPRYFEFEPKHPYADLTDEELMQRIREIDSQLDTSFRFVQAAFTWSGATVSASLLRCSNSLRR